MAAAGCVGINFGIESLSADVAREMNCEPKRKNLDKVTAVFKKCRKLDIETFAFFVHGLPNDSGDTIRANVDFAKKLEPDNVQFTIAVPFPGTELLRTAISEGLLVQSEWEHFSGLEPVMKTRYLSIDDVARLNKRAYGAFFARPGRIMKELRYPGRLIRRMLTYAGWMMR
jgi:radical SAM superfamily enzyme YgiQ (UPF0313 family)